MDYGRMVLLVMKRRKKAPSRASQGCHRQSKLADTLYEEVIAADPFPVMNTVFKTVFPTGRKKIHKIPIIIPRCIAYCQYGPRGNRC